MEKARLDKKHELILKFTVALYIKEKSPISSSILLEKYPKETNCSSAKIRYLMNDLEKDGYLKKAHSSSGRIPTILGLDYYAKHLANSSEDKLIRKINQVFKQKERKIDQTIESAAEIITEMTGLTLVTTSYTANALLKGIDLVPLSKETATVVIVISTGEVFSNIISFNSDEISINDLKIAVKIFKENLIDVPINNLEREILDLKKTLSQSVKNYQKIIETIIKNVISLNFKQSNIYGKNNIILSNQINRENLSRMIDLIENHSVWESIEREMENEEKLRIAVNDTGAYMSKRIDDGAKVTEISVVGGIASDFDDMKSVLNALERYLKNK
ncbi:heat-inducible transcriptional repressor HrcA [Mycoplasmopsis gallopavonis]|uniref:Heat-inducible transcription repressor HrcA n=1 Tax=Mycoplasmopsis gallopavonis TaxID=76629 RepID=A0A449B0K0_9BACT|nr:heat-inducible transcriptional repressor HrcA [Mycoplasmopsis gallopavonis]RIV16769.1 heat-inducible transcriptional repressor HrcA [Mycoplasmopsis gallopavonis]VEU73264.1 heat inducible transcription repressor HrcA [Mycoplasmopsis gallopavonis]